MLIFTLLLSNEMRERRDCFFFLKSLLGASSWTVSWACKQDPAIEGLNFFLLS